jgi:RNA polymerase sigma-70 factor, ECF subfamily
MRRMSLAAARGFLEALEASGHAALATREIAEQWGARLEEARLRWPGIVIDDRAFADYVAARLVDSDAWPRMVLTDLYVACSCARGDERAMAAVDRGPLQLAAEALRRRFNDDVVNEACQIVRTQLFTLRADSTRGITSYGGRGDLHGWLRVTLTREAVRLARPPIASATTNDIVDAVGEADPELMFMKAAYRDHFKAAFATSLSELSLREQRLLRYHFIDHLSLSQIGALHRVHRATAMRWLAKARETLLSGIRREMMLRLAVSVTEVDSILRLVDSQLEISFQRLVVGAND